MQNHYKRQVFIAAIVYLGQTSVGYAMGWSAPITSILQNPDETPLPEAITDQQSSWVGSLLYVGAFTGPYISSYISNVKGRKISLYFGATSSAVSLVILALTKNIAMIYAGRILMGFGAGIIFVMNLVYIGEIASTKIRGILLTTVAAFHTVGTVIVYSIGPYASYAVTCWMGFILSALFIVGIFFLPESPVFQMLNGEDNEAKDTLKSLGREKDIEMIKALIMNITTVSMAKNSTEIFTIKSNRKALFISLTLNIFQQASGIVAITFFATRIFELAGSSIEPHIATIIIGVTLMCSGAITPFLVERVGRKSLLLFSSSLASLSLGILGLYFFLDRIEHPSVVNIGWLPLLSLVAFCLAYDVGLGVIPGTLTGEMFRANVRSIGSSVSISVAWGAGFGVSTAFGYMLPALGPDFTFWIFAGFTACSVIFTIFFVPETKGKSFIEIEEMLSK